MVASSVSAGAQQTTTAAPAASDQTLLKPGQLDALVAPIRALSGRLGRQHVGGCAYPLEVVEADRWIKENKKLKGGFALVAYPADYGHSGVMTFIVNHAGTIYEKDMGEDTDAIAKAMTSFDPEKGWHKVDAE